MEFDVIADRLLEVGGKALKADSSSEEFMQLHGLYENTFNQFVQAVSGGCRVDRDKLSKINALHGDLLSAMEAERSKMKVSIAKSQVKQNLLSRYKQPSIKRPTLLEG